MAGYLPSLIHYESRPSAKTHDAALRYFERAKHCYQQADQTAEWQRVVDEVHAEHRRKTSFLSRFDDIASESEPAPQPSFLSRAKTRWATPGDGQ
jgi:hypothetical protein